MNKARTPGIGARWIRRALLNTTALLAFGALAFGSATTALAEEYDPEASYPSLPDLSGADIVGESALTVYLHEGRAVVEWDGDFYDISSRALELGFDGLTLITLTFELPDHPNGVDVYLTEDATWTETIEASTDSFDYEFRQGTGVVAFGFEIEGSGQSTPSQPDVVVKPIDDDPT